ncbi:hypothetical protein MKX01_013796 [Papaver californicum]|nr:hypothetical protein MKX01_013796 [Papaver californicum]
MDTSRLNAAIVITYRFGKNRASADIGYKGKVRAERHKSDGHTGRPAGLCKVSPITLAKAVKKLCLAVGDAEFTFEVQDTTALTQFWSWMEEEIHNGVVLTEVEVSDKLLEFRAKQDSFLDTSFDTISGSGANGAIIHYKPEPESYDVVDAKNCYWIAVVNVLMGHIVVDQAVFPENTPGFVLDALARSALWKVGIDYRHGTVHGVGAALNFHEGPQSMSFRFGNMTPLQKGMIVSNEPGYYEDHSFGIRIEELEINTPNHFGGIRYLGFENITFEHFNLTNPIFLPVLVLLVHVKLVELSLMSTAEVDWLNDYHSQVWKKVSSLVEGAASKWLRDNTQPLVKP